MAGEIALSSSGRLTVTSVDVAITDLVPGTAATKLGKAEDAAHTSGDVGVMALGVIKATPIALGADGDYSPPILDELNRLWVRNNGQFAQFTDTTTVDTAIYAGGDLVGGIRTIANWAKATGGGAKLRSVSVWCEDGELAQASLLFFNATPSGGTYTDNLAPVWAAGDFAKFLGKIDIVTADYATIGGDGIATKACEIPLPVAATSLFCVVIATATPTFTAGTDVNITLIAEY